MIQGSPKFDGLAVLEGTFSFLGSTVHVEAKGAFVSSGSGDTHGWTKNTNWSPTVIEKLIELRALMEIDLGRMHFVDGGERVVTSARVAPPTGGDEGGLGGHVGGGIPQV